MAGGPSDALNRWNIKHPVDSNIVILTGEVQLHPRFSIDISYGFGEIKDNTVTDTDYDSDDVISDLSSSISSGDTYFYSPNAYIRVLDDGKRYLEILFGYFYLKNSVSYRDPRVAISGYLPSNLSWKEVWLKYDLTYKGFRFGIRGEVPLFYNVSLKGSAGYIPWLDADYDGLRYPERSPSAQQVEKIDADGWAFDTEIAGSYMPIQNLDVDIGYKYMEFKAEGYDSPDTVWANSWEHLKTDFKGPFLKVNYKF